MKKQIYSLVLGILASLFIVNCSGGGASGSEAAPASGTQTWTYMVYMGADNTLADAGLYDLNEMQTVGSDENVAIVAQAEFSQSYSSISVPTTTRRYVLTHDGDTTDTHLDNYYEDLGNVDMGDPATLTAFIQWAEATYPADHYALVIWDHGDGWRGTSNFITRGAVQDETSGSFMSLPDLASAVSNSGVHLDMINIDACLMAMYEVVYEFRGLTDYMVLSEETEPGDGNPYDTILADLSANPSMTGEELATTTVNDYYDFYAAENRDATTLSAIDMSKVADLDTKVMALSAALSADASTSNTIAAAQTNTQAYTLPENHDLYDLSSYLATNLADGAAKTAAQDLVDFIPTMVVANKTTQDSVANSYGLAIYLPTVAQTTPTDMTNYALLACNQSRSSTSGTWGAYVESLILAGGGAVEQTGSGGFGVRVDWDCDADVDLYIGEPDGSDAPGSLYSPWMGTTTPNGFFSQDSAVSGTSSESFIAGDTIADGDYYILINYYADGSSCTSTAATVSIIDPNNGIDAYTEVTVANGFATTAASPRTMSLENMLPDVFPADPFDLNDYSDWWVPLATTRSVTGASFNGNDVGVFSTPNKRGQAILRYKKSSRVY